MTCCMCDVYLYHTATLRSIVPHEQTVNLSIKTALKVTMPIIILICLLLLSIL